MFLKRAQWVTDKYILVMLGLFPLFWGFRGYNRITESKFWFFAITTGVWVLAVICLLVIGRIKKERYALELRPAHIAFALFLAVGALSAASSPYGLECLLGADRNDGYLTTAAYGLVFFGVSWLGIPKRRHVWAMGISVTLCCIVAVLQLAGLDPFSLYPEGTNYYDKFVAYNSAFLGTIGNTGLLSAYLCLGAPLLAVFGFLSAHDADKFLLVPASLATGIMVMCDVDAGMVALAGCVLITIPVVLRGKKAAHIACGISGGTALAGLSTLYLWQGTSGTFYEMSQVLHGHMSDEFGSHRGQIWKRCMELFRERPWLGGGPGTAAKRLDIIWSSDIRTVSVQNTHNVYLGYLVNMGIFALAAYIGAAVCSFITWIRHRHDGAIFPALGSAVLCYMIQDFFGLGLPLTEPMLFVLWGLLESTALPYNREKN